MRRIFLPATVTAGILVGSGFAAAQSAVGIMTAVRNCQNAELAPQLRIESCSAVIHTNLVSHGVLAAFYFDRGVAYEAARDLDDARHDYAKALELKPDFAQAQTSLARLSGQSAASPPPSPAVVK